MRGGRPGPQAPGACFPFLAFCLQGSAAPARGPPSGPNSCLGSVLSWTRPILLVFTRAVDLCILGCAGSLSLLRLLSGRGVRASRRGGPACCGARAREQRRGGRRWAEEPRGQRSRWPAVRAEAESRTRLRHQHLQGLNCFSLFLLHSQVPLSRQGSLCTLLIARFLFCFVLFSWKSQIGEQFDNENGMIWKHSWKTCQVCCYS